MHLFRVLLHGRGLKLMNDVTGDVVTGGVYVSRTLAAPDETAAVTAVINGLWQDADFTEQLLNLSHAEIEFEAEEVEVCSPSEEQSYTSAFYIEVAGETRR